jgi:hypothetical protein
MTLTTRINIFQGATDLPSAKQIWDLCASVCAVPYGYKPEISEDGDLVESAIGIGAKAWISVRHEFRQCHVTLDTAYAGEGPSVHNAVVSTLMKSLPSDCHLMAYNEFDAEWHYRKEPYD